VSRTSLPHTTAFVALFVASLFSGGAAARAEDETGFRPLFDGKTLDGWIQRSGKAKYTVEDGAIVGTTVLDTPNSFLCTDRDYGDFILLVEFKVDPGMNSGIQIRSEYAKEEIEIEREGKKGKVKQKFPADTVYGYQVEIDPGDRAWSGGIYDEKRRGWLNDLKNKPEARKAFKKNDWNEFRIECRGDSIKTWINGVPAADLKDDMTPKGLIGLQVHRTTKPETMQVRWRNIRIKEL
jgi:hypothetical protein